MEPGSEPNTRMDLYNESPSNPNQNVVCCKESTSVHALPPVDARKSASSPRNGEKGRAARMPARRSPSRGLGRDSRSGHFPRFVSRTTRFTPPVRQHCLAASLDWISETLPCCSRHFCKSTRVQHVKGLGRGKTCPSQRVADSLKRLPHPRVSSSSQRNWCELLCKKKTPSIECIHSNQLGWIASPPCDYSVMPRCIAIPPCSPLCMGAQPAMGGRHSSQLRKGAPAQKHRQEA